MQIVTEEFLLKGLKSFNTINKSQLTLLDVKSEDKKGWKERVLGKQISDARAELFVLLKGAAGDKKQQAIIADFKNLQKVQKSIETIENPSVAIGMNKVTIYCDGGCVPNPGKSGSGVAIYHDDVLHELWYGLYDEMGTNNTAELHALYQSLLLAQEASKKVSDVEIKCDSMYSINCISVWAIGWEKKGWTKKGGEIKNLDIIQPAYKLFTSIKNKVKLSHIKAHAGTEGNELADRMTMYTILKEEKEFVCYDEVIDIPKLLKMRAG